MAVKTANVLARVEPEIKREAEEILAQLGVPASVLINMLYRQIIMTRSIPFSVSIPKTPVSRDEMSDTEFCQMMEQGLQEAKEDLSLPAEEVFAQLRRGFSE